MGFTTIKICDKISITKEYFLNEGLNNLKWIKDIKINKKSISITINKDKKFNSIFNEKYYLSVIIFSLGSYIENNFYYGKSNIDLRNYLNNRFKKLYVKRI